MVQVAAKLYKLIELLFLGLIFAGALVFIGGPFWNYYLPKLDGRLRPVVSNLTVTGYERRDQVTVLRGYATKHRECTYLDIEWYLGDPDGRAAQISAYFEDRPQIRPMGRLEWEAIVVGLNPKLIKESSYAYVVHRCNGSPFRTRTRFYVPENWPPEVRVQ